MRTLFLYLLLCCSVISCVEKWTLNTQGEEVSSELNVAASAIFSDGLLSFSANAAQFGSSVTEITPFPQDSLILDLTVGDKTYTIRKTWEKYTHRDLGYYPDKIRVTGNLDSISFKIHDKKGNFKDVYANAHFPESITPSITVTPFKYSGERAWMDSSYTADILIPDPAEKRNYYMIAVEFLYWAAINGAKSEESQSNGFHWNDFVYEDGLGWMSVGYYPFSSSNPVFVDSEIMTSINGFNIGFSNIFSDELFNGKTYSITLSFKNILKDFFYQDPYHAASLPPTNALTPFKIHFCSLSEADYKYYKKIQHLALKKHSIFDEPASLPSNIQGGYGYFSAINSTEYLYFDGKVHE